MPEAITSECPSCGLEASREPYDIGSGPELSCNACEWCWGAEGQDLQPLSTDQVVLAMNLQRESLGMPPVVAPLCPGCNEPPELVMGDRQAFCGNDDCQVFTWDLMDDPAKFKAKAVRLDLPDFTQQNIMPND